MARAYHVEQSARPGDAAAIALLEQAAESSQATSPATAARFCASALRLLPSDDTDRRTGLLVAMADALAAAGQIEPGARRV